MKTKVKKINNLDKDYIISAIRTQSICLNSILKVMESEEIIDEYDYAVEILKRVEKEISRIKKTVKKQLSA